MSTENNNQLTNPDLWIRLVYMILFALLSILSRILISIVAAVQFLVVLFSGEGNHHLRRFGYGLAEWTSQAYLFLSFNTEDKPFPFADWPEPDQPVNEPASSSSSSASSSAMPVSSADMPQQSTPGTAAATKPAEDATDEPEDEAKNASTVDAESGSRY